MMKSVSSLFAILILSESAESQNEGWYWLNPLPTANAVKSMKFVNTLTGYAACESGTVIKTVNGGSAWQVLKISTTADFDAIYFIDANTGTVAGQKGLIYRTANGGLDWTAQTFNDTLTFNAVTFIDANTGIIVTDYWRNGRIYKTTNGGTNWTLKFMGGWNSYYAAAFITSTKVLVAGEGQLLKSTDAGESWGLVSVTYGSMTGISFVDQNNGFISASVLNGPNYEYWVFRTKDGGENWDHVNTGARWAVSSIAFLNVNTGIVVGRYSQVLRTTNRGANWILLSPPMDTSRWYYVAASIGTNRLYYGGDGGIIFASSNSGAGFVRSSRSFTDERLYSASFINNTTGIVCGANGAIFKTIDGGLNWYQQYCEGAATLIKVKLFDEATGIAVSSNGRVYKTIDGGSFWNVMFLDTAARWWSTADMSDPLNIFVTGGYCSHAGARTTNGGITWDTLYIQCNCSGPPPSGCTSIEEIAMADPRHICMIGSIQPPHFSGYPFAVATVDGNSFFTVFQGQSGEYGMTTVSYADTSNGMVSGGYYYRLRTFNGFRTVTEYGNPAQYGTSLRSVSLMDSLQGLSLYSKAIYKTTNGGLNWYLSGTPGYMFDKISYYKFNYAAAWGRYGALVANLNPGILTGAQELTNQIPSHFRLYQNYPNPFNPATKIKFDIPSNLKSEICNLKLYDILGREVATLVNKQLKPGTYQIEWDAANFPSGVYFYRLQAGHYSEAKKMILLK